MEQVLDAGVVINWAGIVLLLIGIVLILPARATWAKLRPGDSLKASFIMALVTSLCATSFILSIITAISGPLLAHPEKAISQHYVNAKLADQSAFITKEGQICLYNINRNSDIFFIKSSYKIHVTCSQ